MISAEISQVQSCQQDEEGVNLQNSVTTEELQIQANETVSQIEVYENLLIDLDTISLNCGIQVYFPALKVRISYFLLDHNLNFSHGILQLHL